MSSVRLTLPFLILLGACSTLAPMAMNMHVPAMGALAESLNVGRETASLTVTVYLWIYGGAMLFVGLPADRFGRRPTLIVSLFVFLAGTSLAMIAESLNMILLARAIAALGAAAVVVVPRTTINDCASGQEAVRYFGLLGTIMAAAPAAGPIVGDLLNRFWGWHSIFGLQAVVAVVCLIWCIVALPETRPSVEARKHEAENPSGGAKLSEVIGPVFVMAMTTALYFAFLAAGADALVVHFQEESWKLAALLGALSVVFVCGNMLTARLSNRFTPVQLLRAGAALLVVSLPLSVLASFVSYELVAAAMCIYALGNGLITPTSLAVAGGVEGSKKAMVMSIASSTPYLLGGALAALTVSLKLTTWLRFEGVMIVCALLSAVVAFWSKDPQRKSKV